MALPRDDHELARWVTFVVTRWRLDRKPKDSCFQAICLGMPMTRADYFKIVRSYVNRYDETATLNAKEQP